MAHSVMIFCSIGLHQVSLLSLLLFMIVLEVLSREMKSRFPEELLYVDDLSLVG